MSLIQDRTVWFPKDFLLFVLWTTPIWGIAGVVWGLAMAPAIGPAGFLLDWVFRGLLWGATLWFCMLIILTISCREVSTSIRFRDFGDLSERLEKAAKSIRYTMEQQSLRHFVCKPKHGIARRFKFQTLQVSMEDDRVNLAGPSNVVNKVRKQLLAKSSLRVIPAH